MNHTTTQLFLVNEADELPDQRRMVSHFDNAEEVVDGSRQVDIHVCKIQVQAGLMKTFDKTSSEL